MLLQFSFPWVGHLFTNEYIYIYIYYFFILFLRGEALCRTGSATTYAKHESLHPATNKTKQAKQPNPKPNSTAATQAKTQGSHGERAGDEPRGKSERERTNRPGNPNRSPTQPQLLRPKTQKPRRESGKRSRRRARTNTNRTAHGSECKRGGGTSCNPGSCRAVAEKTGQRPPVVARQF